MTLDAILLGILRTPASGYEIKRQFDEVFSHFWSAELPQIYRTLRRLEDDGQLASSSEASEKGPERRMYRLTAKGRRTLARWLREPPSRDVERIGFLAHTYFLGALGDDGAALDYMRELRDVLAAQLATLQGIASGWAQQNPHYPDFPDADDFYAQLALDLGLHKLAAKVEWAERCIARIQRRIEEHDDANVA